MRNLTVKEIDAMTLDALATEINELLRGHDGWADKVGRRIVVCEQDGYHEDRTKLDVRLARTYLKWLNTIETRKDADDKQGRMSLYESRRFSDFVSTDEFEIAMGRKRPPGAE